MQKNDIGKTAGISGAVAVIVTIICQVIHGGGVP
tara:strand:- start:144 stop:245 length:102 start_codon:yes stop_codon:yes gene_type:complete